MRASVVGFIVLAAAYACSPFAATNEGAAAPDAGDGGLADGGKVTSADAGPGTAFSCPPGALLCDDFERTPDAIKGNWTSLFTGDLSTKLSLGSELVTSGSSSLFVDITATTADATALVYDSPTPIASRVDVTLSMRTQLAPALTHHFVTVEFASLDYAQLIVKKGKLVVIEQRLQKNDPFYLEKIVADIPTTAFSRYTFVVDRAGRRIALESEGGAELGSLAFTLSHEEIHKVLLGAPYTADAISKMWIDDVVIATP